MKIAVGSDHAAFEHKTHIIEGLKEEGHDVIDLGTHSTASCDYPDAGVAVSKAVASGEAERGVLLCGTGIGMSMTANKVKGIRAAVCHDEYTTIMSRSHNDANVLCLGGRVLTPEEAWDLVNVWLRTPFDGGRHRRRVEKIMSTEKEDTRK